jgi:hypothetical protein
LILEPKIANQQGISKTIPLQAKIYPAMFVSVNEDNGIDLVKTASWEQNCSMALPKFLKIREKG